MTRPNPSAFEVMAGLGRDALRAKLYPLISIRAPDECWPWRGRPQNGYGKFSVCGDGKDRVRIVAHRVAWIVEHWRDPGELLVCHSCDNRLCCNPAHLWLGTALDNHADMVAKGRRASMKWPRRVMAGPKLTREQAEAIRHRDLRPTEVVAATYGVCARHVMAIRAGTVWSPAVGKGSGL